MGLLNVERVTKTYGQRLLLDEVTFAVERGEHLAMIGPNGSGKTTLVRMAMKLETPDTGSVTLSRGIQAGFLTQDLSTLSGEENALHWGEIAALEDKLRAMERQMETTEEGAMPALLQAYERLTARYEALDGYTVESRLKAMLLGLGLRKEALATPMDRLSSGERMRVALARILLRGPDLIVLDEPTNHLDIAATMWLEEYLSAFTGGVFLISHDRYFLDRVATRIIELKNATTVVHHGNYSGFLQQQAIRKAFLESEKERLDHEIRSESALARKLRATAHITQAKSREKGIERLRVARVQVRASQTEGHLGKVNAVGLRLTHDAHISAEVAAARHAGKRFGERVLLEDANFLIRGGEHVAFVGANGCGKTTLLRMLLGQDDDHTGTCRLGSWVRVGLLDQNAEFIDEARTMLAEVIKQREQPEDTARTLLGKVGFYGDEIQKTIDKLSGGERVRLKLALLLQQAPQCLVLDEPTNHLDLPAREAVERAVADFRGTVLAVSHDRYFLNRCATRIIAFEGVHLVSYAGNWDVYQQTLAARMQPEIPAQQAVHAKHGESPAARAEDSSARIAEMEREIASLEAQMQQMTHRMMPDAPPSLYQDYEQASKQLEMLYEQWTKLG